VLNEPSRGGGLAGDAEPGGGAAAGAAAGAGHAESGYIPGSQREQRFDNADIGPELGALFEVYPQWKDADPALNPLVYPSV
jgi:hypothetical protein